jgi:cephalosporin hydroxylase
MEATQDAAPVVPDAADAPADEITGRLEQLEQTKARIFVHIEHMAESYAAASAALKVLKPHLCAGEHAAVPPSKLPARCAERNGGMSAEARAAALAAFHAACGDWKLAHHATHEALREAGARVSWLEAALEARREALGVQHWACCTPGQA